MRLSRIVFCFVFILVFSLLFQCRQKKKDDIDPQLLSAILSQGSPIDSACQRFILSEANCVAASDPALTVCPGLITAVKNRILPANKSSDATAVLYFNCFTEANLLYNGAKGCGKNSFNSNSQYRNNQRVGTDNPEIVWRDEFNSCASLNGKLPDPGTDLAKSETTLSSDPFQ